MGKYYPIQLSEEYIASITSSGDATGLSAYDKIIKYAEESFACDIDVGKEDLVKALLYCAGKRFLSESNSIQNDSAYKKVKTFAEKAVARLRQESNFEGATVSDFVQSLLIPLAFEKWQKTKIVYQMSNEIIEDVESVVNPIVSIKGLDNVPSPFWIDLSDNSKKEKGILVAFVNTGTDIIVIGWSFADDNINNYHVYYTGFSIADANEVEIATTPCKGIDASFILNFISFIQSIFVEIKESDLTKNTYKPYKEEAVKNKFSEVRIFEVGMKE